MSGSGFIQQALSEASRKTGGAAGVAERWILSDVILLKMARGVQGDINRSQITYSSRPSNSSLKHIYTFFFVNNLN